MTDARRRWLATAAVAWLLVIAWSTLRSNPAAAFRLTETSWHCVVCGEGGATDVFLNLLLFAPLGLLARAAGWKWWWIVPACALLSTGIECTQGLLLVGRDATLGDVLANTTGSAIGFAAQPWLAARVGVRGAAARRSAVVALVAACAVWGTTAWALRPALDGPAPWTGQLVHLWPGHDPFGGHLDSTAIDGIPIPNDPLGVLPPRRDTFDLLVAVTRTSTAVPRRPVSLVRIVDRDRAVQVGVSQSRNDLVLEVRMRASRFRVRTPEWRFAGAMAIPVGQPWVFRWRWRDNRVELVSGPAGSTATVTASRAASIATGWVLIHPFTDQIGAAAPWWTLLWTAWWFALVGWFGGAISARAAWGFGAAAVAGFAVAALLTGMTPAWHAIAGALGGYAAAALFQRRRSIN